jgi:transcriptional regulator with XRE-family HTH domain
VNETLRSLRLARAWTQAEAADEVSKTVFVLLGTIPNGIDSSWIGRLETGRLKWPNQDYRAALRTVYGVATDRELGLSGARSRSVVELDVKPDLYRLEQLRRALDDTLNEGTMAPSTLDNWENEVLRYGTVSRDRPAGLLVSDLSTDMAELQRLLSKPRPVSSMRQLTRITAQMAGLLCLALVKLNDRQAFRGWARIARVAADEAGDPETLSWVLAQESYGHYYSGDYSEAAAVAVMAQESTRTTPRVGAVLAAALEGRAHAAMGSATDCRRALESAALILADLGPESINDSAFGYDEGQLRFHEGNAYTHLHDTQAAWTAQQRALELSAPNDFMDRSLTQLDRASCLAYDGDTFGALEYAAETLGALNDRQREGIITLRGFELLNTIPVQQRALPAARELRERLTTPDTNEVDQ